ncbi:hypothetical protein [Nonomuraea sp. NPDC050540]|uniref:hypothetical protein n=1 Tax=Nonomuraea sp. NPDC050540 TaxID=3364367 RepID=UPI00378B6223
MIGVYGFGFGAGIAARNVAGTKAAAAAAIEELTGRRVTGWEPDASSRSIQGESSWYPHDIGTMASPQHQGTSAHEPVSLARALIEASAQERTQGRGLSHRRHRRAPS